MQIENFRVDRPIFLMLLVYPLFVWLNYDARAMQGILPYYQQYKALILSGFSTDAIRVGSGTFPMWGYGWILLLTENKALILLFQGLLGILSIAYLADTIEKYKLIALIDMRLFKILILVAVPFWAFHTVMWPYSLAGSLFLFSLSALLAGIHAPRRPIGFFVLSGLLFGILLNFRSDYYLMPLGMVLITLLVAKTDRRLLLGFFTWGLLIYLCLIPWALYTKKITGRYLIKSTNAGYVFFIGLGSLPNNRWGITPRDEDPKLRRVIETQFGKSYVEYHHEVDAFVKKTVLSEIREHPGEYVRKCTYAFFRLVTSGVYRGEFFEGSQSLLDNPLLMKIKGLGTYSKQSVINIVREFPLSSVKLALHPRMLLTVLSELTGRLVVFLSFILLPLTLLYAVRNSNVALLLTLAAIGYQSAISIVAYHLPSYTSNVFILHCLNVFLGIQILRERKQLTLNVQSNSKLGSA